MNHNWLTPYILGLAISRGQEHQVADHWMMVKDGWAIEEPAIVSLPPLSPGMIFDGRHRLRALDLWAADTYEVPTIFSIGEPLKLETYLHRYHHGLIPRASFDLACWQLAD